VFSRAQKTAKQPVKANTHKVSKTQMANFTAAINALVDERDRQFLLRVASDFNLPFEQLSKLYLEVSATAIKVPRKYTKKPKAVAVVTEGADSAPDAAPAAEPKAPKEPKAKAEKQKCTACTSKKEPCKFSALKGEVFCKRHLRATQEESGEVAPKKKAAKTPAVKAVQPVHTHALTENAQGECDLCESHGNPLGEEAEFEVVLGTAGTAPMAPPFVPHTVAERLAAILSDSGDDAESDAESEAYAEMGGLTEEGFEEDD
jgi:hypothetical protein